MAVAPARAGAIASNTQAFRKTWLVRALPSASRMPRDEGHGGGTVETILAYLDDHPDAADTVDGIRQWWLPGGADQSTADVQAALDLLVERGLIARVEQPGIPPVYRRTLRPRGRPRTA